MEEFSQRNDHQKYKNSVTQGSERTLAFEQISAQQSSLGGGPLLRAVVTGVSRHLSVYRLSSTFGGTTASQYLGSPLGVPWCFGEPLGVAAPLGRKAPLGVAAPLGKQPHLAVPSGGPQHPLVASLFWRIPRWLAAPIRAPGFPAHSRCPLLTR
jgi:hypothetical protein